MKDTMKDYVDAILFTVGKDNTEFTTQELCESLLVMVWENLPDAKKEVITSACGRNYYNTSTYEMSRAECYVYSSGIEYVFEGTRTGFNLFVTTDGVIGRKKKGDLLEEFDMYNVLYGLDYEHFTYRGDIDTDLNLDLLYDISADSVYMYTSLAYIFIDSYQIDTQDKSPEYRDLVRRIENNSLGALIDAYGHNTNFNIESTRKGYRLTIPTDEYGYNTYSVLVESFEFFPVRGAKLYEDDSDVEDNRMALINMDDIGVTTSGYDYLDGLDNISGSELVTYLNNNYAPFTYTQFNDTIKIESSGLGKIILGSNIVDSSRLVKEIVW